MFFVQCFFEHMKTPEVSTARPKANNDFFSDDVFFSCFEVLVPWVTVQSRAGKLPRGGECLKSMGDLLERGPHWNQNFAH